MASVRLEHIYKVYPNGVKAVEDMSLDIKNGEFIVFVGPSGCGKSTTLRMVAGLEDITAGELYIDNQIVNDMEPKDRDIAMVFQNYALYPHMTVYENMAFGLRLRHVPDDIIQEKVLWAADILGIRDYLDRKPKAMSGGQRQRVALGRAILRDPKVMLLDEPLSNLDAKLRAQMRTEIAKLHQRLKTTFIYVTHDQTEAMTLGDRVVVMKKGRVQQVDTPKNLYNYPANLFVAGFIGTPQMNFFDVTLTRKGEKVDVKLTKTGQVLSLDYNQLIKVLPQYLTGEKKVVLGIRCENVLLAKKNDPNAIPVRVSHNEELGADCLIYGNIDLNSEEISSNAKGSIIIKVLDVSGIKPGDVIYVQMDLAHAYFFDAETENMIVPRIPVYNSLTANVKTNNLEVLGQSYPLPPALATSDVEGAELEVPTDAVHIGEGPLKAKVVENEVINSTHLIHLFAGNRIFFALDTKDYPVGSEVSLSFDPTLLSLKKDGKVLFSPLSERDSFTATFYNYDTVMSKNPDPAFQKFRDDKIKAAQSVMDAKFVMENMDYDKKRLAISNESAVNTKEKAKADFDAKKQENETKIAQSKAETKKSLEVLEADFKKKKEEAKKQNDELFRKKKEEEEAEYKSFKAHNKDKEVLKRREDEYHIFKDNFQTDKENAYELLLNGLTMDYESKVSTLKASSHRQQDLWKKEIKDAKEAEKKAENPLFYLNKEHQEKLNNLTKEKKEAVNRAGLVFFFALPGGHYEMASDIISNKLIQGLGTRVFSKTFRIDMPHDGFVEAEGNNAFKAVVEDNLDYGKTVFVKLGYKGEDGQTHSFYFKSDKPLEVGKELHLGFNLETSAITETEMNIRLY